MAYDSARQRVVLFGGSGSTGNLGDTWEWDGSNWLARISLNYPSPRTGHAMAYHAASQRVILFGGLGGSGNLGDTWEWNGTNWTHATPSVSPPGRADHAMAYDAARQRVVLFGGNSGGSAYLGDTWEWDGTNWTQLAPASSPPSRADHAMAYDEGRQRTVMFGGGYYTASYTVMAHPGLPGYFPPIYVTYTAPTKWGDTREWDGTNWTQLTPASSPPARAKHAMAYDAPHQRIVLFGGYYDDNYPIMTFPGSLPFIPPIYAPYPSIVLVTLGDTWVNSLPVTVASATAYGAGCGSPALGFVPDANGRPLLGQVASATIVNAPAPIAFVAMGLNDQTFGPFVFPLPLAGIGMPGCDLLQSTDILGLGVSLLTPATLSYSLAIPNALGLIGMRLYMQAYAYAPGYNPAQIIISNGVEWLLGDI